MNGSRKAPPAPGPSSGVKEVLLAAAKQIALERGWQHVTVRAVATQAGASAGLVQYYFGSMPDLLRQTAEQLLVSATDPVLAALIGSPDLASGLEAAVAVLRDPGTSMQTRLLLELVMAAEQDADIRLAVRAATIAAEGMLASQLRAWSGSSTVSQDVEFQAQAELIISTLDGLAIRQLIGGVDDTLAATLRVLPFTLALR